MKEKVNDALKLHFRPEFLNRIDEVIVFHELNRAEVLQIVDNLTRRLTSQLEGQGLGIELTQAAKELLAGKGYDPQLGARPLRRAIQRLVEDPLSEMLLYKQFRAGEIIVVDTEDDPDKPGEQRIKFSAVEGFVPPAAVELATTATASTHVLKPRPGDEPAAEPESTPPTTGAASTDPAVIRRSTAHGRRTRPGAARPSRVPPSDRPQTRPGRFERTVRRHALLRVAQPRPALVRRPRRRHPRRGHRVGRRLRRRPLHGRRRAAPAARSRRRSRPPRRWPALAVATDRVRLGSLVFGITYRHPAVLANWADDRRPHVATAGCCSASAPAGRSTSTSSTASSSAARRAHRPLRGVAARCSTGCCARRSTTVDGRVLPRSTDAVMRAQAGAGRRCRSSSAAGATG